jgi:leader peptidase (prepilin peptidase)/N-methyltransferase
MPSSGLILHGWASSFIALSTLLALLLGLTFGSFASVLVARVPLRDSLAGRSRCPKCKHQLTTWQNIPVFSYLLLRGRCRFCQEKISPLYLALELTSGFLFVIGLYIAPNWSFLALWIVLTIFGLPLAAVDLLHHKLPNRITLALAISNLVIILASSITNHDRIVPALIGALALPLFYLALAIISRGGMGMGDIKLAAPLGLVAAFFGHAWVLVSTFAAFIFGAILGIAAMIFGKAGRKSAIPFGPFMIVGQFLALYLYALKP